jgi:YrbI family 3-deoxy-D-manno-octulosonate 8-phosphate phosphatase
LKESLSLIDLIKIDLHKIHTIIFDFDGVFTDNKVWIDQNGLEMICCSREDGLGIKMLKNYKKQIKWDGNFLVLSTEKNSVVSKRMDKLGILCFQGIPNKLKFIREKLITQFSSDKEIFSGLIYLGNDLNDLSVMKLAKYSFAPIDAHPIVKKYATFVLPQKGGQGFVRAFIEGLININILTEEKIDELISNC